MKTMSRVDYFAPRLFRGNLALDATNYYLQPFKLNINAFQWRCCHDSFFPFLQPPSYNQIRILCLITFFSLTKSLSSTTKSLETRSLKSLLFSSILTFSNKNSVVLLDYYFCSKKSYPLIDFDFFLLDSLRRSSLSFLQRFVNDLFLTFVNEIECWNILVNLDS